MLGKVKVSGLNASLQQIKAGYAWHYKFYQNEQPPEDRETYAGAEREARRARRGSWADASPVAPWDFRRGGRRNSNEAATDGVTAGTAPGTALIGNRRSMIYQRPDCPNYGDVSPQNRVPFRTGGEAEASGYGVARNRPGK